MSSVRLICVKEKGWTMSKKMTSVDFILTGFHNSMEEKLFHCNYVYRLAPKKRRDKRGESEVLIIKL